MRFDKLATISIRYYCTHYSFSRIALERDSTVAGTLEKFCEYTSSHGFAWYLRTDSTCVKALVFVTMVAVGISMIVWVSVDFAAFLASSGMTDATTRMEATAIMYPNVSLCNAKYFSNERLRGAVCTGLQYKAGPRLRECCREVETEMVSNSRNKFHQTWGPPYTGALYVMR